MKVLKTNKTKMYQLIKDFGEIELPIMKETEFIKAPRSRAWWLEFTKYRCYLSCCAGKCLIGIKDYEGKYNTVIIPFEELVKRKMIEEI